MVVKVICATVHVPRSRLPCAPRTWRCTCQPRRHLAQIAKIDVIVAVHMSVAPLFMWRRSIVSKCTLTRNRAIKLCSHTCNIRKTEPRRLKRINASSFRILYTVLQMYCTSGEIRWEIQRRINVQIKPKSDFAGSFWRGSPVKSVVAKVITRLTCTVLFYKGTRKTETVVTRRFLQNGRSWTGLWMSEPEPWTLNHDCWPATVNIFMYKTKIILFRIKFLIKGIADMEIGL